MPIDPSTTVAELVAYGVDHLNVTCGDCGAQWMHPILPMAAGDTIARANVAIACTACGSQAVTIDSDTLD